MEESDAVAESALRAILGVGAEQSLSLNRSRSLHFAAESADEDIPYAVRVPLRPDIPHSAHPVPLPFGACAQSRNAMFGTASPAAALASTRPGWAPPEMSSAMASAVGRHLAGTCGFEFRIRAVVSVELHPGAEVSRPALGAVGPDQCPTQRIRRALRTGLRRPRATDACAVGTGSDEGNGAHVGVSTGEADRDRLVP